MMLSVLVHLHSLQWTLPTFIMMGSAPIFMPLWAVFRLVTCLTPGIYRRGDDHLYSLYQRLILFFFHTYTRLEVYLYGDCDIFKKRENVIYICNHQSTVDWVVANMLAVQNGSIGRIRYILKDGLKFLPIYGFYFRQHGGIYVKRDRKFNDAKSRKDVKEIKDTKTPVWLVIFPEGTRFNPEKESVIQKSRQFAEKQGFKALDNVLMPRIKALEIGLKELEDHVTAIYDVTIAYSNTRNSTGNRMSSPSMPDFLMGASSQLHLFVERIDASTVPHESRQLQQWLYNQFSKKDRLLSKFYSKEEIDLNSCFGPGRLLDIRHRQTLPALCFWGLCLTGLLWTEKGRTFYWRSLVTWTVGGIVWMSIRS